MPSVKPETFKHQGSMRKVILALILLSVVLALSPVIAKSVFVPPLFPIDVPVPKLTDPNAIQPETVAGIHLLAHWGNGRFNSIAWSPDGRYFVVGTTLGVNLYDGQTYQLLRYIDLPLRNIDLLAFSPDSALLAVSTEQNILLMELASGKIIQQWGMDEFIVGLAFLKDGTLVCVADLRTGENARSILKLEKERWRTVKTLDDDFLMDIAFVPEKQSFAVFYDRSVRLVDPLSGKEEILPYIAPYGGEYVLTGNTLFTIERENYLLSVFSSGGLLDSIGLEELTGQPLASPDGSLLATLGFSSNTMPDDSIILWKIPELEQFRMIPVPDMSPYVRNHIAFSPSGDRLALLVSSSTVKIFPTGANDTGEFVIQDPFASIADIAITPAGEIQGVSCSGMAVHILELPSTISIAKWDFDEPTCGQLLDDGAAVAISEPDGSDRLFSVSGVAAPIIVSGYCCSKYSTHGTVGATSVGPSSSGDPATVTIWQRGLGQQRWNFYNDGYDDFGVAISPTGQYVAATSRSNTYLWFNGVKSSRTYPALISGLAFSPDEKYLASANDFFIGILGLDSGLITMLELESTYEYIPYYSTPAFSPDGQILAAEVDGTLRFWNASNGTLLAKLDDPYFTTHELVFSPDSTFLVGVGDGFVNMWGLSKAE